MSDDTTKQQDQNNLGSVLPQDDSRPEQKTTSDLPPVVVMEDVKPPMPEEQNNPQDIVNISPADSSAGTSSPADDIAQTAVVSQVKPPQKKFAGGRVIATILGLFLLIGGTAAGVFLVQKNQNINEMARINEPCKVCKSKSCATIASGVNCNPALNECSSDTDCGGGDGGNPGGGGGGIGGGGNECFPGSRKQVDCTTTSGCANGSRTIYCTPNGFWGKVGTLADSTYVGICVAKAGLCEESCNPNTQIWNGSMCVSKPASGANCDSEVGYACTVGTDCHCSDGEACTTKICDPATHTSCVDAQKRAWCPNYNNSNAYTCCLPGYICASTKGCIKPVTPTDKPPVSTPKPTVTPTATPITAQCQNVKAYSETWSLLSSTQLSALKSGNKAYFCVTGVATGGSFDRAKFTINSVAQAETTIKRPGSDDFCQLYTIPTGVYSFNVTAQIHHATLGWK